jgi:uncharacterized delta-60 repeat protein
VTGAPRDSLLRIASFAVVLWTLFAVIDSATTQAAPGDLDATFSGDGLVTDSPVYAEAIAIQSDGKILVAGISIEMISYNFGIARFNTDGTLDSSFGGGDGVATTSVFSNDDYAKDVVVQPDGKIVAAGEGAGEFILVRYDSDGSLDTSFGGGDGIATTDISGSTDGANALALQNDGKLIAAGRAAVGESGDVALARYNTDGSLDTTFGGGDGKVTTDFTGDFESANSLALQSDGRFVIAGGSFSGNYFGEDTPLARYNTDGSLDTTFGGGDGYVMSKISSNGVAVQADGQILAAGAGFGVFEMARFTDSGSLDTTFGGGDGTVITDFTSQNDLASSIALQPDGRIILAGVAYEDIAIARYTTNGALDSSFSADGKVVTDLNNQINRGSDVALQADGKIIVSGKTTEPSVARYEGGGLLPPPVQYNLSVARAGTGTGTVTSSPGDIDCGSVCTDSFGEETAVVLSASAGDGSIFTGWSGGGCSGTGACIVTLNADFSVTAIFTTRGSENREPPPTGEGSTPSSDEEFFSPKANNRKPGGTRKKSKAKKRALAKCKKLKRKAKKRCIAKSKSVKRTRNRRVDM